MSQVPGSPGGREGGRGGREILSAHNSGTLLPSPQKGRKGSGGAGEQCSTSTTTTTAMGGGRWTAYHRRDTRDARFYDRQERRASPRGERRDREMRERV